MVLNMAIEIVDLPSYKMVIFHSYVSLPVCNIWQMVLPYSKMGIFQFANCKRKNQRVGHWAGHHYDASKQF